MDNDPVNHPSHYTAYKGLEVIDLTEQMNFNKGNAVKYIARAGLKNPDTEIEDLKKAAWYINREISRLLDDVLEKKSRMAEELYQSGIKAMLEHEKTTSEEKKQAPHGVTYSKNMSDYERSEIRRKYKSTCPETGRHIFELTLTGSVYMCVLCGCMIDFSGIKF